MRILYALALAGAFFSGQSAQASGPGKQPGRSAHVINPKALVVPGHLIIKLMPGQSADVLKDAAGSLQASAPVRMFPRHTAPSAEEAKKGFVDLSRLYELKFSAPYRMETVLSMFRHLKGVEYAEPRYMHKTTYTPTDSMIAQQVHLLRIKAREAWDVHRGDTSTVIGIVDSGVDWMHPDLIGNIAYNYADPIDGLDNDNDGYVDNFRGWDLAGADYNAALGDNNPAPTGFNNGHGTHVAGCAAPSTDNFIGVAGPGFRCRILPVKCAADNDTRAPGGAGYILTGYEGIVYAADHDVDVINCSWGGAGLSDFENDLIDYATFNKNILVVAAAGNDNSSADFFPACFNNVLSVAATSNQNDSRAGFSNYNMRVGVAAPGVNIWSTIFGGSYGQASGTSMASPITAGAAAMVRSLYPTLSPRQVAQLIRVTSDNIYTVNQNPIYAGKLGKGRLNMYRALTEQSPGIVLKNYNLSDGNDEYFASGDTLRMSASFLNLLFPSSVNLKATFRVTTGSMSVAPGTDTLRLGAMAMGDSVRPASDVVFFVDGTADQDEVVTIRVDFRDGVYTDFATITLSLNSSYVNFAHNIIASTVASNGRLGFSGTNQEDGLGVQLIGWGNLLYELGQITVNNSTSLMLASSVRSNNQANPVHDDFTPTNLVKPVNGLLAPYEFAGSYTAQALHLRYDHHTYVRDGVADKGYYIHSYVMTNEGSSPASNLFTGYFMDGDVSESGQADVAQWDAANHMGYIYGADSSFSNNGGPYIGIQLLDDAYTRNCTPITNDHSDGPIDAYTDFSPQAHLAAIGSGIARLRAPDNGRKDVSLGVGYGPFSLAVGESKTFYYSVLVGNDLQSLQNSAHQADSLHTLIIDAVKPVQSSVQVTLYPNPSQDQLTVACPVNSRIEVLDLRGQVLSSVANPGRNSAEVSLSTLSPGTYLVRVTTASGQAVRRFVKQ